MYTWSYLWVFSKTQTTLTSNSLSTCLCTCAVNQAAPAVPGFPVFGHKLPSLGSESSASALWCHPSKKWWSRNRIMRWDKVRWRNNPRNNSSLYLWVCTWLAAFSLVSRSSSFLLRPSRFLRSTWFASTCSDKFFVASVSLSSNFFICPKSSWFRSTSC